MKRLLCDKHFYHCSLNLSSAALSNHLDTYAKTEQIGASSLHIDYSFSKLLILTLLHYPCLMVPGAFLNDCFISDDLPHLRRENSQTEKPFLILRSNSLISSFLLQKFVESTIFPKTKGFIIIMCHIFACRKYTRQ